MESVTRTKDHLAAQPMDSPSRVPNISTPIEAFTRTYHRPTGPVAYDCVKLIVVRDGSPFLYSAFGQKPVKVGDAILFCANTPCGCEPEGHFTVTTIYMGTDYVIDQVF